MNLYCGKCWETRGVLEALISLRHFPFSKLPKPEKRDHAGCARVIHLCPFCRAERHPDKEYEAVHRHFRRERGVMVDHFVTRRYPQVVDDKQIAAKLAA